MTDTPQPAPNFDEQNREAYQALTERGYSADVNYINILNPPPAQPAPELFRCPVCENNIHACSKCGHCTQHYCKCKQAAAPELLREDDKAALMVGHWPDFAAAVADNQRLRAELEQAHQKSLAMHIQQQIIVGQRDVAEAALATAQRWIPCSERMPRLYEWALVVCGGDKVQRMAANWSGQVWDWADEDADCAPKDAVTHWRPLPTPPDTEEGND